MAISVGNDSHVTQPLLILGASGNARQVYAIAQAMNEARPVDPPWELLGFIDDGEPDLEPIKRLGTTVVGGSSDLPDYAGACYCIGIGSATIRASPSARLLWWGWVRW